MTAGFSYLPGICDSIDLGWPHVVICAIGTSIDGCDLGPIGFQTIVYMTQSLWDRIYVIVGRYARLRLPFHND